VRTDIYDKNSSKFITFSSLLVIIPHFHTCLSYRYRFQDRQRAIGVYQSVLNPPTSICDVTYWLNFLAEERRKNEGYHGETIAAINTAGE
jgi:hypothetical protein